MFITKFVDFSNQYVVTSLHTSEPSNPSSRLILLHFYQTLENPLSTATYYEENLWLDYNRKLRYKLT